MAYDLILKVVEDHGLNNRVVACTFPSIGVGKRLATYIEALINPPFPFFLCIGTYLESKIAEVLKSCPTLLNKIYKIQSRITMSEACKTRFADLVQKKFNDKQAPVFSTSFKSTYQMMKVMHEEKELFGTWATMITDNILEDEKKALAFLIKFLEPFYRASVEATQSCDSILGAHLALVYVLVRNPTRENLTIIDEARAEYAENKLLNEVVVAAEGVEADLNEFLDSFSTDTVFLSTAADPHLGPGSKLPIFQPLPGFLERARSLIVPAN